MVQVPEVADVVGGALGEPDLERHALVREAVRGGDRLAGAILRVAVHRAAAHGALGQAGALILRSHVDTCVTEAMTTGTSHQRKKKIDELMEVFSRYSRIGAR